MNFIQKYLRNMLKKNAKANALSYRKYLRGTSILDYGSGSGLQAQSIQEVAPRSHISCLDVGDFRWDEAKDLEFNIYDGRNIPFEKDSFDTSLAQLALHHIKDARGAVSELARVTNSRLIIVEEIYGDLIQLVFLTAYDVLVNFLIIGKFIDLPRFKSLPEWNQILSRFKFKHIETVIRPRYMGWGVQRVVFVIDK